MKLLYYTQTYYLDAAIETIRSLQNTDLQIDLIIEITPDAKCSNIIDIKNLKQAKSLTDFKKLIGIEKAKAFEPYFKSIKTVRFLVFKQTSLFRFNSFSTIFKFLICLFKINPDVIHFDTVTFRSLLFVPFLRNFKKVITIHDPIPHIGDTSWKKSLTQYIYFKLAHNFVFYSNYARNQFEYHYTNLLQPKYLLQFQPFTFNQQFVIPNKICSPTCILFFGRISFYKGIDLLMEVIPDILDKYPNQIFVIAGKTDKYALDYTFFKKYEQSIVLMNKHISTSEAVHLILKSKFLICPYRDASQSGVLMTAKALGKTIIATNVGAFSEYIKDGFDGLIAEPTKDDLTNKILYFLDQNRYKDYENNVSKHYSLQHAYSNQKTLLQAYSIT
jgi:glycosyltransferase involved in cell wall biosynthesis